MIDCITKLATNQSKFIELALNLPRPIEKPIDQKMMREELKKKKKVE